MCDEQVGESQLILQIRHQVQDLGLDGNIQRGYGFVADNEFRVQSQCPCDSDTLPASAIQFMRISVDQAVGQTDQVHDLSDPFLDLCFVFSGIYLLNKERCGNSFAHCHSRIQ